MSGQGSQDVLSKAIAEVLLRRISGLVDEREHCNARLASLEAHRRWIAGVIDRCNECYAQCHYQDQEVGRRPPPRDPRLTWSCKRLPFSRDPERADGTRD